MRFVAVGGTWMAREGGVRGGRPRRGPMAAHMKGREAEIAVGLGRREATAWTRDLTHGFIDTNGSHRS